MFIHEEDNLDWLLRCHYPNISHISLGPWVDAMRSLGTLTLSDGTCGENRGTRSTNPMSTLRPRFLKSVAFPRCFQQRAHNTDLLHFCSLRWEKGASLLLPESPTGSPCRGALWGRRTHWSDPDAAGVWRDSRGAWRPRSALIDRGQELGVRFLDSRFVLPILLLCVLCTMLRRRYASSLALRLTSAECLTNSFYNHRLKP